MRLSCLMSLDENSLRMSKKARFTGGYPSPWGFGSLKANSIPSLQAKCRVKQRFNHRPLKIPPCSSQCHRKQIHENSIGLEEAYLCNMAIASLVLSWSRPKVREKRRASSLMPQKAEDERSKPGPRSDSISLNNYTNVTPCNTHFVNVYKKMDLVVWNKHTLTCCKLRMSVFAHWILSICLVLLIVSLMMSP